MEIGDTLHWVQHSLMYDYRVGVESITTSRITTVVSVLYNNNNDIASTDNRSPLPPPSPLFHPHVVAMTLALAWLTITTIYYAEITLDQYIIHNITGIHYYPPASFLDNNYWRNILIQFCFKMYFDPSEMCPVERHKWNISSELSRQLTSDTSAHSCMTPLKDK